MNAVLFAEAFHFHALAAKPGEAKRVIKRMKHRKAQMHPLQRQAGSSQPFTKALYQCFQVVARQRRLGQPIGNLIHENGGNFCLRCAHAISRPVEDEPFSFLTTQR